MSFSVEVAKPNHRVNLVIEVDGVKYATRQPDSGLTVASTHRIVAGAEIPPNSIHLREASTKIQRTVVDLLDLAQIVTMQIGNSSSSLIGKAVKIWVGFSGVSMPFADYVQIADVIIRDISKLTSGSRNVYRFNCVGEDNEIQLPVFQVQGHLDSDITSSATTIIINNTPDDFTTTGLIRIDDEIISYSGKSYSAGQTTFTGCTRGTNGSINVAHTGGVEIFQIVKLEGNPITLLLQLLISDGGGGTYDVLDDGAGISQTKIDVTKFESIRTNFFSGETFRLFLSDVPNLLKFIEENLLLPTNTRLIHNSTDQKLSLAILDQSNLAAVVPEITDDTGLPDATWEVSRKTIINRVRVKWDWSEGLRRFEKTDVFEDADSIADFGETRGPDIEIKGAQSDLSGDTIVQDRANRFLGRFSTPKVEITKKAFLSTFEINVGDKVRLVDRELPAEGGSLGLSSVVEVLDRAPDLKTGLLRYKLVFTSYSNLRIGLIAPASPLSSITSQSSFSVTDGTAYFVGDKVRLWNSTTKSYEADPVNEIATITGNVVTMVTPWSTTLTTTHRLRYADYDVVTTQQKGRYGFISPASDFFADGSKAYQIVL